MQWAEKQKAEKAAKPEPYSDPFHKEAERKSKETQQAWLKSKPKVDINKLRSGDYKTYEEYMKWRWAAPSFTDGYDAMMEDFGGLEAYEKATRKAIWGK